jgi:hypothetical protein
MTGPLEPLPPDLVDELLSAELDGELADAAADLGFTLEEVDARLAATPGVDTRRAHLGRARAVLAVEPLPEETRAAFVARAVAEGPVDELSKRRRRLLPIISGSVAAALLVVVGVTAISGGGDDDDATSVADAGGELAEEPTADEGAPAYESDASSDDAAEGPQVAEGTDNRGNLSFSADQPVQFGDVTDPAQLRAAARRAVTVYVEYSARVAETQEEDGDASPAPTSAPAAVSLDASGSILTKAAECLADQAGDDPVIVRGTGQYNGEPAEVLIVQREDDVFEALVLAADCTMLSSQFLPS